MDTVVDAGRYDLLTVAEAAERLGITKEAVRKRISRGTLRSDRGPDGEVLVYVPPSPTTSGTTSGESRDELVAELRDQVSYLRSQLDQERDANRENRRIIAGLTSRIPELEQARRPEDPQRSEDAAQGSAGAAPGPAPPAGGKEEPRGSERSWWRRMFGG